VHLQREVQQHKVGLVKNLALMGNITLTRRNQVYIIKGFLSDKLLDLHDITPGDLKTHTRVFLNGEWLGLSNQPRRLYMALKKMKYNGDLDPTVSIVHEIKSDIESKELRICCDGGRIFRPYFVVKDNTVQITKEHINTIIIKGKSSAATSANWNEFLIKNKGIIEYLDTDEMSNSMIAMFPVDVENMRQKQVDTAKIITQIKIEDNHAIVNRYDDFVFVDYTHCEIHPSMMIGAVVANIPYSNHNQGPRNIFQYSQARQAMGLYAANYRDRLDISYILYHAQRPLISTRLTKYISTDALPAGENSVVAIACYSGFNVILIAL
jgi:DNA-directed RNA polymerase II subunit RPB2